MVKKIIEMDLLRNENVIYHKKSIINYELECVHT